MPYKYEPTLEKQIQDATMEKALQLLSTRKINLMTVDSAILAEWRRNPTKATKDLFDIDLLDYQSYILQSSWNAEQSLWCQSRNSGKTFLAAIFLSLKAMLYENKKIYIISNVGRQAQLCFEKIEALAMNADDSVRTNSKILAGEVVVTPQSKNGFKKAPQGFVVKFHSGSYIMTKNGIVDNNRGERADVLFFDEAGFSSDDLLGVTGAYTAQNKNFKTGGNLDIGVGVLPREVPTQIIYASSASSVETVFFTKYKEFFKRMIIGDDRYFVCDIPVDIPLSPTMKGEKYQQLITQSKIDSEMATDREKAIREYYNKFDKDGGDQQFIKRATIIKNSKHDLPRLANEDGSKYILAVDPARAQDNSIFGAMRICYDDVRGYHGVIDNVFSFIDYMKKSKRPMLSHQQVDLFREFVLDYNGNVQDFQNIHHLYIDAGAGGAGVARWGDDLLMPWTDKHGITHNGFIDHNNKNYDVYQQDYKWNHKQCSVLEPRTNRTRLFVQLEELMDLGLIEFTYEYDGSGFVKQETIDENGDVVIYDKPLSMDEEVALLQIDMLKKECAAMRKYQNAERTDVKYQLPSELVKKMHDDRVYVLALLADGLYQLRKKDNLKVERPKKNRAFCFS